MNQVFYNLTVEEAVKALKSDFQNGLGEEEAEKRLTEYGLNQLQGKKGVSPFTVFLGQFKDFIIWILIGAALISGFLQEWVDALAIIAIVIVNAILGFLQEYRAEKSLAALKKLSNPVSKVIRDSQHKAISSSKLVPGDVIEIEAGDSIPADSRLVWTSANFGVQEASLTGESTPVTKSTHVLKEKDIPLADRANEVYMGTSVASGKAKALVVHTGMQTELGKIAGMVQAVAHETTPLQKKLEEFSKWLVYLCFVMVGMVFLLGTDVVFTNLSKVSSGNLLYNWKFGDGKNSSSGSPRHNYDINGISKTYNVTLVALVPGGCSDSITKAVTINALPNSDFSYRISGRLAYFNAKSTNASNYYWRFGDGGNSEETNPYYHFLEYPSKDYKVCLVVNNASGCQSETCKNIAITSGVSELSASSGLQIYPNPSNGKFTINIDSPKPDLSISIYNILGNLVKKIETSSFKSTYTIDLNVSNGVYVVKVENGGKTTTQKVTIN